MVKRGIRTSPRKGTAKGKVKAASSPPKKKVEKAGAGAKGGKGKAPSSPFKKTVVEAKTSGNAKKAPPVDGGGKVQAPKSPPKRKSGVEAVQAPKSPPKRKSGVEADPSPPRKKARAARESEPTEDDVVSDEETDEETQIDATKAPNPYDIDFEALEELDVDGCVKLWKWFAFEKEKARRFFVTNERGEEEEVLRGSTKRMLLLGAALVVHFYWFGKCEKLPYTKKKLGATVGVYNNRTRIEKTNNLVNKMNEAHRFLEEGSNAFIFVKSYDFGQTYQYFKSRFKLPKDDPVGWWEDDHVFSDKNPYGLHVVWKQFFDCIGLTFE